MNARGNQRRNTEHHGDSPAPLPDGKAAAAPEEAGVRDDSDSSASARVLGIPHLLTIGLLIAFFDQLTKWMVARSLYLHESHTLIPGLLSITRIHNTGIAFGMFPHLPGVLTVVTVVSVLVVLYFYLTLENRNTWVTIGCGLILGGAVGNLIDRVRLGHVVDFIYFSFWPAFNVADSAVSVGVALLMIGFFLGEKEAKRNASDTV